MIFKVPAFGQGFLYSGKKRFNAIHSRLRLTKKKGYQNQLKLYLKNFTTNPIYTEHKDTCFYQMI